MYKLLVSFLIFLNVFLRLISAGEIDDVDVDAAEARVRREAAAMTRNLCVWRSWSQKERKVQSLLGAK